VLALRLARALDEGDRALARLGIALAKFQVCKSTPPLVAEAVECLGGNGYVEESGLPRLYREAPLNSIWEGAGNVNALDVLRAAARSPEALEAVLAEVALADGLGREVDEARAGLADEAGARRSAERLALLLQASLLLRHGDPLVAELFVATRLRGEGGRAYGTLPSGRDLAAIVERHRPQPVTTPASTSAAISASA
jgi:putative acyl-CoA dehydrogenase